MDWFALVWCFSLLTGFLPPYSVFTTADNSTILVTAVNTTSDNTTSSPPDRNSTNITPLTSTASLIITNSSAATTSTSLTTSASTVATGCSGPPDLCCPGRNDSCYRGCFCDEICVTLGDCCPDYNSTCKQSNSTTLAPLNVTTTSGSSLSSTFSPTSSNSAIAIVRLKVSLLSNSEAKERAILEISSFLQRLVQQRCNGCAVTVKPV
ncbi:mucin-19-like isoform X1 [Oreochromis niloticus]|uniref:mucin-19-like isoform X1 n=1 Tax=Oreochromis niloticus TaxID=8128 RepID=UPI000393CE23|nr:mucin-19-like isoform X1 [Oreochromis niloticus]